MRRSGQGLLLLALFSVSAAAQTLDQARALQQKGALREAQSAYESLLPRLRQKDPAALAAALNALSQIASAQGDYDGALARAVESTQVYRSLGDKAGETRALNSAGAAEIYRGGYRAALLHFRDALAIARGQNDGEGEVDELNNIGSVYYMQASYLDALRSYREAMDRVDRAAAQPWSARKRGITVANLAALFQRLGQEEQALQLYAELRRSSPLLEPSEQARLLTNLGVLYRRLGDPVKALESYQSARQLLEREEHQDARIGVLKNIGIVQALDLGDLPAALEAFNSALALAQRTGNRREAMQARLYRGEALARRGDPAAQADFEAALAAAKELGTTEEQWKALYGLGRALRAAGRDDLAAARFREAIAAIESVRARLQLAVLRTDFLADKRDVYDALIELTLPGAGAAAIFDLVERSRARTFQDRLAQAPPTLAAVQARLDPATLLLEFWVGPRGAMALWVTSEDAGIATFALPGDELDELVGQVSGGSGDDWKRVAAALGERLLGGVAPLSRGRLRHLIVVPDGPLAKLPFEVLAPRPGPLLLERFSVSYLPSAALLLRDPPRAARSWAFPWERQLVVFADPRISSAAGRNAADALGGAELWGRLPASADEARAIAGTCRGRAQLHLGSDDLKSYLVGGAAAGVPLLHLATHAMADTTNPARSRILFSPAGADDRADYLFLEEVYGVDLRGVDLATLSACDTERGKAVRGEGVQGFSRALLSAGARAAVTTLWRVADEPAREVMQQFYRELNRGEPKAEALGAAKLRLYRSATELRHPRFWAPFVLSGEGLRPIPRVVSWSVLLAAAGAIALAAVLAMRRRRRRRPRLEPGSRA